MFGLPTNKQKQDNVSECRVSRTHNLICSAFTLPICLWISDHFRLDLYVLASVPGTSFLSCTFDFSTQTSLPHNVTAFWTKCCESVGFKLQTHKFLRFQGLHTYMPRLNWWNNFKFTRSFVCLVILSEQFIVFCFVCCFCFNISVF